MGNRENVNVFLIKLTCIVKYLCVLKHARDSVFYFRIPHSSSRLFLAQHLITHRRITFKAWSERTCHHRQLDFPSVVVLISPQLLKWSCVWKTNYKSQTKKFNKCQQNNFSLMIMGKTDFIRSKPGKIFYYFVHQSPLKFIQKEFLYFENWNENQTHTWHEVKSNNKSLKIQSTNRLKISVEVIANIIKQTFFGSTRQTVWACLENAKDNENDERKKMFFCTHTNICRAHNELRGDSLASWSL